MHDAFRNDDALARRELHRAAFQVDEKAAFDHVKEFVVLLSCRRRVVNPDLLR